MYALGLGMGLGMRLKAYLRRSEGEEILGHAHQGGDSGAVVALGGVGMGGGGGGH